ncbi:hypothetical protein J4422_00670 [Candidatus Pacearchaeota archaeon]|nr:hypothetical protein [Candidatus Pacearchaeota archaeon]
MMQQIAQIQRPMQIQKLSQVQSTSSKLGQSKAIIFDSGTLISFSMNGVTDLIRELRGIFKGKFLITSEVKKEIIDTPLRIKKFELEALKIKQLLDDKILEMPSSLGITDSEISKKGNEILSTANSFFIGNGREIHLLDSGESSCLALSRILTERGIKNIIAIDERTTRMLVEKHENMREFLEKKLHVRIKVNHESLRFFNGFKIIRSTELAYVAYKKGLVKLKNADVLDALLYAMKFKGASISSEEIEEMKKLV